VFLSSWRFLIFLVLPRSISSSELLALRLRPSFDSHFDWSPLHDLTSGLRFSSSRTLDPLDPSQVTERPICLRSGLLSHFLTGASGLSRPYRSGDRRNGASRSGDRRNGASRSGDRLGERLSARFVGLVLFFSSHSPSLSEAAREWAFFFFFFFFFLLLPGSLLLLSVSLGIYHLSAALGG